MSKNEFILQGFTTRTHAQAVRQLFDLEDIQKAFLSVAFITESGVQQIEDKLKAYAAGVTVFAGIRNDITSYQGLVRLFNIGGTLYTVDTGSRTLLFHPKLFMVRAKDRAALVMGSANLTLGGLNNNIEAGMLIDFDLDDETDKAVVDKIEAQLAALPKDYPDNVVKMGTVATLNKMLAAGRLVDEMALPPPRITWPAGGAGTSDPVPRMKLKTRPLASSRTLARRVGKKAVSSKAVISPKSPAAILVSATLGDPLELMWESKPLSRRSLTIPKGTGSHPTGSRTLGKGMFKGINPVTYFRKDVFGHLAWAIYENKEGEKADAEFDLVIKGVLVGTFPLTLRHSFRRAKAAKKDKNLPTEISWNDAKSFIQKEDLLGRTMKIYQSKTNPMKFRIDID